MSKLHLALESATAVYYKPSRTSLLMLAHSGAFFMIALTFLLLSVFAGVTLSIVFTSLWPLLYCVMPLLIGFLFLSYHAGKELKMMKQVLRSVEVETGIKMNIHEARPMVHQIMGYLFAQRVIQEHE